MSIASPWPFLAINFACFVLAWGILLRSRFYRELVSGLGGGRTQMIDGLRGWLALGVFFEHVADMWFFHHNGEWDAAAGAPFYATTGPVGVSLFFMITGYLFWTKVLRGGGSLDAGKLYVSRLRRLLPMYLVSVAAAMAVVAVLSGFSLRSEPAALLRELRSWLSFGFMYAGDINGVHDAHHINAVYWTLAYEWAFYLALPFLAVFARFPAFFALFALAVLYGTLAPIVLNFLCGALAAIAVHRRLVSRRLDAPVLTPLPLAALAMVFAFAGPHPVAQSALLLVFFMFVVHGNSLFGLLASGPAKLLGTVSYSIYLVHCVVLFSAVRLVGARFPVPQLAASTYWLIAGGAALLTVLVSTLTYRYVEHPFIAGKQPAPRAAAPDGDAPVPLRRAA
jgi:peptidoglycan/LPS O-acetylase OafA/YrhL